MVPAFLGSSFAFISPTIVCITSAISPEIGFRNALGGFVASGIIFIIVSTVVRIAGRSWLNIILPPAAIGAIVALIGLELAPIAAKMAFLDSSGQISGIATIISIFTLLTVVTGSLVFRKFFSTVCILISVFSGYALAAVINIWIPGTLDFSSVHNSSFFTIPKLSLPIIDWPSIIIIIPAALVVISEDIGHLFVVSNIVGRDLLKKPGLHKSLLGDGMSTMLAGICGSCPTTTYGENMGVMAITKVYSVWVVGGAGIISIVLAFFGKVSGAIRSIPTPVIGGVSMMLFGVIAASGLRMLIEAKVDFSKSRNLLHTAVILVVGNSKLAIKFGHIELTGMVLATIVAIIISIWFHTLDSFGLTNES